MIVITGGTGLIGSAIIKQLASAGRPLLALKREASDTALAEQSNAQIQWKTADILDVLSLNECFKNASTVIHAAAKVSFNPQEKKDLFRVNVEGTQNVVNACLASGVKKLIHISSVAALGRQKGSPIIDETNKWEDSPLNSSYAQSKYLAELEVYRGMEEGLPASIVNPSLTLAPGDWEKSSAKIFKYIWNENKFFAEGQCNYVDVRDVATVVFKLLDGDHAGQRFIASGGVIQYKDLFDQIANRFKKKGPSIKVNSSLITAFAVLEELRGRLVKSQPLVTRESVKSTRENFAFSNEKSVRELAIDYHRLAETLDFCCDYYLRTYSTNK